MNLIFRCLCTVNAFLIVVLPLVTPVTLRQLLPIAFYPGFVDLRCLVWILHLHVFLRGRGGSASFSKIDTSVCSTFGTRTLSLMRQFIEDAEKESEKETGTGVSELNVKDTRCDSNDVSCQEGSTTQDKEAIKALKVLFEDFEDRLQYQNEVFDESASEDGEEQEEPPQETTVHSAIFSPCDEAREFLPCREPQLYLCDDWIQPMAVLSRPNELCKPETK